MFFTKLQIAFDNYSFVEAHAKEECNCNAVVMRPMIMWSNTWSGTWSNTWPSHIIFRKQTNLILLLSDSSSSTYHLSSETSIESILVVSRCYHWSATFVARRRHYQPIDQRSKTSTNIAIILINAIYMEFYECWSSGIPIAKLHLQPIRAWSSLLLAYQLIAMSTPFRSDVWVRKALGHRRGRKWSGKRMAGWRQSENLLLGCQH